MAVIVLKRIYEDATDDDGFRILVDRLWPRGIKKEDARLDLWLKEIGPSTELRKWFNHEDEKWGEFKKKYLIELEGNSAITKQLKDAVAKHEKVTLLFSAKNEKHNQAVFLKQWLNS